MSSQPAMKFILNCVFLIILFQLGKSSQPEEKVASFWINKGDEELKAALEVEQNLNKNVAKNVIMYLGDGMGVPSITAGRILKGQLMGNSGEETILAMDRLNHAGMSKTYSVNKQVSDSGSTATAYLCGVKTNNYVIGLSGGAVKDVCASATPDTYVYSVLVDAWKAGKSAGIVTTARVTHATPAGAYAHSVERDWEADSDLTDEAKQNGCEDIAQQFIKYAHMFEVVLGGGRKNFFPATTTDPEYPNKTNKREDGDDLVQKWLNDRASEKKEAVYVWNQAQFDKVDPESTDFLLGLFDPSHMKYEAERNEDVGGEPSIAQMTEKAIQILQKNEKGFILLVEGGRIDHGHHAGSAYLALHDTVAFDDAIEKGLEMTSSGDTLTIVTADHSHTLSIGGYSIRGNPIFGIASSNEDPYIALDGKRFTTLLYGNGPGYELAENASCEYVRDNVTVRDTESPKYLQQAAVPLISETHGGEDVTIFASGPMAYLFHGVHEQSYIATVMRFALCVGDYEESCASSVASNDAIFLGLYLSGREAQTALNVIFVLLVVVTLIAAVLMFLLFKTKSSTDLSSESDKESEEGRMLRKTEKV